MLKRKEAPMSKKKKKAKKQTIKIFFKDGKTDEIPQKFWDDYLYDSSGGSSLFVVIKKGAWIAMYNMSEVACVTVG